MAGLDSILLWGSSKLRTLLKPNLPGYYGDVNPSITFLTVFKMLWMAQHPHNTPVNKVLGGVVIYYYPTVVANQVQPLGKINL